LCLPALPAATPQLAVLVQVSTICPLGHFQLALRALELRAAP
jgi:hypothetical protein